MTSTPETEPRRIIRSTTVYILVTYDVSTTDDAGKRRLRRVARACEDYGQRVQNSVFECSVDPSQFAELKHRLLEVIDPGTDSVRFYFLGKSWLKERRVEHHGSKPSFDIDGPLMV